MDGCLESSLLLTIWNTVSFYSIIASFTQYIPSTISPFIRIPCNYNCDVITIHSSQIHLLTSIDAYANGPQAQVTEFRRAAFCVVLFSKSFMLLALTKLELCSTTTALIEILYNAHHTNPTLHRVKSYSIKNMDWSNLFQTVSQSLFLISRFILYLFMVFIWKVKLMERS